RYGSRCGGAWHRATLGELQVSQARGDGVCAQDGGGAVGGAGGVDPRDADGHRLPPRQEPSGALGAAGDEASAKTGGPADAIPSRSPAAAKSLEILLN